ncbi:TPA: BppU family phage baseplate upper protein [Listeria monocytogenes]|nr:BppU family phage baseplate upper protein [Listeria monocytogenes]HEL6565014.1 BppU family phage baseplate upper protein [Listeria monocytogenes]
MTALRKINATLDLNRKSWNIERIEAVQGDIDSLMIAVQIVENGKLKDLTDYKPTFAVVLPGTVKYVIDDLHFSNEKMNEGYFEYTFVKEAFSVPGVYDTARFILQNEDGTELSGMPRFTYYVEKDPLQGKVVAESYISDFERLEQMIHAVELEIAELHDEVTSESVRLDSEIAALDEKINTETSKLQSEADDLQQQFDNLNPAQFAQKTVLDEHVNDADIHVTATDKTNWNAKETVSSAQAKADKALSDAKTDASLKAAQALADAKAYTDSKITQTVWTGSFYMSASQTVTPSIPLNQCKAWIIYWSKYSAGAARDYYWCTQIVTKETYGGHNFDAMMDNSPVHKYLYVSATQLTGSDDNSTGTNNQAVMRKVVALL